MDSGTSPGPRHVAVIMDGNGRWARERGMPRLAGHRAGTEHIRQVIRIFSDNGIKFLTLYAFSTENWGRPKAEVRGLFKLLGEVIEREAQALNREGVKINHLGSLDGLNDGLRNRVEGALELTKSNDKLILNVAFNYGGRAEILDAVRRIVAGGLSPEAIDEATFESYLYTRGLPDPDLIIRTGGEMRLSNFLLYQAAYSEYYSTPTYWPDFGEADIKQALLAYSRRQRRFGAL